MMVDLGNNAYVLTCPSDALGDSSTGSNTEVEGSSSDFNCRFILIFFQLNHGVTFIFCAIIGFLVEHMLLSSSPGSLTLIRFVMKAITKLSNRLAFDEIYAVLFIQNNEDKGDDKRIHQ
ncbi:hypothetical protein [Aeromonas salmonicida]|uniref:hypothetical protein n=1 Tax=Aeromonas salmonicida TaxID=645 RepID=UPI00223FF03B|nr:hypothetical protein [Aeromonas salmonicida]